MYVGSSFFLESFSDRRGYARTYFIVQIILLGNADSIVLHLSKELDWELPVPPEIVPTQNNNAPTTRLQPPRGNLKKKRASADDSDFYSSRDPERVGERCVILSFFLFFLVPKLFLHFFLLAMYGFLRAQMVVNGSSSYNVNWAFRSPFQRARPTLAITRDNRLLG